MYMRSHVAKPQHYNTTSGVMRPLSHTLQQHCLLHDVAKPIATQNMCCRVLLSNTIQFPMVVVCCWATHCSDMNFFVCFVCYNNTNQRSDRDSLPSYCTMSLYITSLRLHRRWHLGNGRSFEGGVHPTEQLWMICTILASASLTHHHLRRDRTRFGNVYWRPHRLRS